MAHIKSGVPTRVGSWVISGFVGSGGQASVYLGKKHQLNGTVLEAAIKLIPLSPQSIKSAQLLAHESEVLQKLDNPHVARVLDGGWEDINGEHFAWLATELIKGDDLDTEIRKFGPLSKHQWLELAFDLFSAISASHEEGIIHCDIKPGNILRDARKSVLIDFGYASFVRITDPGDVMASTPGFQAPEQLDGDINPEDYEYPVDLFSLGVTLVFAGTGWLPWDVPTEMIQADKYLQKVLEDKRSGANAVRNAQLSCINERAKYMRTLKTENPRLDGLDADQVSIVSKLLQPKPTLRGSAAETLLHIQDLLPEGTSRKSGKTDYARRKPFSPGSMRGQSAKEILREAKREVKDEISKEVGEALAPVVAKATEKVREITAEKKDFKTALTLSTWWGWLGIDRLYLGKYGSGILKMLTGGGYGFWWYLDTKSILSGTAVDAYGRGLENQPEDLAAVRKRNAIKFISALVAVIGLLSLFSFLGNKSLSELHQVPSVSGMNLSVAKNALSNFNVVETDGTDQGRIVVDEANWKICSQTPTSGELNGRDPLTLRVVKLEENCP